MRTVVDLLTLNVGVMPALLLLARDVIYVQEIVIAQCPTQCVMHRIYVLRLLVQELISVLLMRSAPVVHTSNACRVLVILCLVEEETFVRAVQIAQRTNT